MKSAVVTILTLVLGSVSMAHASDAPFTCHIMKSEDTKVSVSSNDFKVELGDYVGQKLGDSCYAAIVDNVAGSLMVQFRNSACEDNQAPSRAVAQDAIIKSPNGVLLHIAPDSKDIDVTFRSPLRGDDSALKVETQLKCSRGLPGRGPLPTLER